MLKTLPIKVAQNLLTSIFSLFFKDFVAILLSATSSKNKKYTRKEEKKKIVIQKRIKVKQTIENAREIAANIGVKE